MDEEPRKAESQAEELERLRFRIATLESVEFECARALHALSVSEARYRSLLDEAVFPITISHISTSEILFANPMACRLFGLDGPVPAGGKMLDYYPDPALRTAMTQRLREQGPVRDWEVVMRDGSGRLAQLIVSASLITYEGQEAVLATSNDITARRHAEALFQTVVETSPDGFAISDLAGQVTYLSPRTVTMLGFSRAEEVLGRNLLEFVAEADHGRAAERLQALLLGQYQGPSEWTGLRKDGSPLPLEINGEALRQPDGTPTAHFFIIRDLSNRKRVERSMRWAQKLESLGLMAAGIAHELNNAFQVTQGHLELAQGLCPAEGPLSDLLEHVETGVSRATLLAREMLDYSGRASRMSAPLEVNEVVEDAVALWRDILPASALEVCLGENLPLVYADEGQLMKVLSALVSNAMDAMEGRQGLIQVSTGFQELDRAEMALGFWPAPGREGPFLRIQVQDTGTGIPMDRLERVCDPFFTSKGPGHGLGLSAALGILRAHSACLQILSQPGVGTTMRAYLPVLSEPARAAAPPRVRQSLPGGILVAEDEGAIRDLVVRLVQEWGFAPVLAARDGAEALTLFQEHREDIGILLTDATMPRMSGPAAFEAMRRLSPSLHGVLMSGYSEAFGAGKASSFGFSRFLQKPFRLRDLRATLESLRDAEKEDPEPGA
jgi:PAS domain S-box-containing protein